MRCALVVVLSLLAAPVAVARASEADPPPTSSLPGVLVTLDGPLRQHVPRLRVLVSAPRRVADPGARHVLWRSRTALPASDLEAWLGFEAPGYSTERTVITLDANRLPCVRRYLPRRGAKLMLSASLLGGGGAGDSKNDITMLP